MKSSSNIGTTLKLNGVQNFAQKLLLFWSKLSFWAESHWYVQTSEFKKSGHHMHQECWVEVDGQSSASSGDLRHTAPCRSGRRNFVRLDRASGGKTEADPGKRPALSIRVARCWCVDAQPGNFGDLWDIFASDLELCHKWFQDQIQRTNMNHKPTMTIQI